MDAPAENTGPKQRGRPFMAGQSGNPAGRPKGARNRSTLAAEALLEGEAEGLTRKAIDLALAGDVTALRLCMERLVPPRKERLVAFQLPPLADPGDVQQAIGAIVAAVSAGDISPGEAAPLMSMIEAYRRATGPQDGAASAPVVNVHFTSAPACG